MKKLTRKIRGKLRSLKQRINSLFLGSPLGYKYLKQKNTIYFWSCAYFPAMIRLYRKTRGIPHSTFFNRTLINYSEDASDFFVLQVGANDGYDNDPIHDFIKIYNWSGLLLEPQSYVFENFLKKTYKNHENLTLLNGAVAQDSGRLSLFKISFSNSRWATGLTSFNPLGIERLIASGYIQERARRENISLPKEKKEYIEKIEIAAYSFEELILTHNIEKIDLLQIDAEGFDYELLKMFPFESLKPKFINFEYTHLKDSDFNACKAMLESYNYVLHKSDSDIFCVL